MKLSEPTGAHSEHGPIAFFGTMRALLVNGFIEIIQESVFFVIFLYLCDTFPDTRFPKTVQRV